MLVAPPIVPEPATLKPSVPLITLPDRLPEKVVLLVTAYPAFVDTDWASTRRLAAVPLTCGDQSVGRSP